MGTRRRRRGLVILWKSYREEISPINATVVAAQSRLKSLISFMVSSLSPSRGIAFFIAVNVNKSSTKPIGVELAEVMAPVKNGMSVVLLVPVLAQGYSSKACCSW